MKTAMAFLGMLMFAVPLAAQEHQSENSPNAYQLFADDAGIWDAKVKMFFRGPNGPPTESDGVETTELVGGGKASRTTFKYKMRNKEFEGHGLFGYDSHSKEHVGMWVDNFTPIPSRLSGTYDAEKKTLTMLGVVIDSDGNKIRQKQVTAYLDDETKTLAIFMIIGEGAAEREVKLMEVTAKKRAPAK